MSKKKNIIKKIIFIKKSYVKKITPFYKNNFFFLFNKPRGILTYPINNENNTLINYITNIKKELPRFGLVNRLDRSSSGIIIFCKKKKYIKYFSLKQKKHKITKYYLVLVNGFFFHKKEITCYLKYKKNFFFFLI